MYRHQWVNGKQIDLPAGKVVCVGRNYVAHAKELNNPIPSVPLIFIKPTTTYQAFDGEMMLDADLGTHHYEAEIALLIGKKLDKHSSAPLEGVVGIGLALDLTLRDEQDKLKKLGHPWERAKAYDGSCPITAFSPVTSIEQLQNNEVRFWLNDELKQVGHSQMMIFPYEKLLFEICRFCTLLPGDVILTGTPEGVGKLMNNASLRLQLNDKKPFTAHVSIQ
ncbi:fumarylacetoacetate hydrolase family protein [Pseudoalteromonas sp. T1lg23B]|uniref:fumarylacetoacetate hydrolase family protein n=1 Tax=Pseudoalteromonas sp. T1lg23B TaxID=2077097 RepID=UPI000CF7431F|nr:fumarylacetoacetate hydrolase family protein [Pseudoalteromonas sp. T1lg23B]